MTNTPFKKKRGRPAQKEVPIPPNNKRSARKKGPLHEEKAAAQEEIFPGSEQQYDLDVDENGTKEQATPFNHLLRTLINRDRTELSRVARELEVAENTVYRWINGTSEPRVVHLKRLPDVFPEYRQQVIDAINATFDNILGTTAPHVREVTKVIYQQILEIAAISQDAEARFWQITQTLFDYALGYLDPENQGLAITYAKLMPTQDDGIHSLREVTMHGHHPWPAKQESKAFLGSTTLAGAAAVLQRLQVWSENDPGRALVEIDDFERSACAAPILRDGLLAGVLIVSSTQLDYFRSDQTCKAVGEYALLMGVALSDRDYHPVSLLHLVPMPNLKWQRQQITNSYVDRIILYARTNATSRREAEFCVQRELEQEFEEEARKKLEARRGE